jgi:hypothetical protein
MFLVRCKARGGGDRVTYLNYPVFRIVANPLFATLIPTHLIARGMV